MPKYLPNIAEHAESPFFLNRTLYPNALFSFAHLDRDAVPKRHARKQVKLSYL